MTKVNGIVIVGAGMAGLLAGNLLRHHQPVIFEKEDALPNNHSAVLRFRTSEIGNRLNIDFRRVVMVKDYAPWHNSVADALAYSYKVTGEYRTDRSIVAGQVTAERWIAPNNFITLMAANITDFEFSHDGMKHGKGPLPIISTIPMPALMVILDYPERNDIEFKWREGFNVKATISNCDAYVSLLIPDPSCKISRVSITGNELIIEVPMAMDEREKSPTFYIQLAAHFLGIPIKQIHSPTMYRQRYAKIKAIPEMQRKEFMFWATDKFGIFSLGRYATWRPGLLLDDLVKDIGLIDRWIKDGRYNMARHR